MTFSGHCQSISTAFLQMHVLLNLPMMETYENNRKHLFLKHVLYYCKSSLKPCGGWQEGVVDMDYGVLVWVAGVGMRPFTRALCEKIGKAGALTLTVWQWRIQGLNHANRQVIMIKIHQRSLKIIQA